VPSLLVPQAERRPAATLAGVWSIGVGFVALLALLLMVAAVVAAVYAWRLTGSRAHQKGRLAQKGAVAPALVLAVLADRPFRCRICDTCKAADTWRAFNGEDSSRTLTPGARPSLRARWRRRARKGRG
jgi:hypothetical protein